MEIPRQPWQGFSLDKYKAVIRPGSLARLELRGYGLIKQNDLQTWSKHVDLSTLRMLKHQSNVQNEALSGGGKL